MYVEAEVAGFASCRAGGGDAFGIGCAGDAQQGGFGEGAGGAKVGVSHATIVASAVEGAPNSVIGYGLWR